MKLLKNGVALKAYFEYNSRMNSDNFDDVNQEIQDALRSLRLNEAEIDRSVSAADFVYLLNQWPFLQITDIRLQMDQQVQSLNILQAKSRWKIHDYGDALSSSPGEFAFGQPGSLKKTGLVKDKDDEEGGSGVGTLVNQGVITAFEMVDLAIQRGWSGIKLIDAHPLMAWAAWMHCLDYGIDLAGYQPSAHDYARWKRIQGEKLGIKSTFKPSR